MDPARRLATYADLERLPEGSKAEIIAGDLFTSPAPLPRHSRPQRALSRFIGGPFDDDDGFDGPGGWWIFVEVDVQLSPHDVVRPDLAGWRRERLVEPDVRPILVVPDWVCEITSPSSASSDRTTKKRLYAKHGVAFYWIVDPEVRALEAYALRDGGWFDAGSYHEQDVARVPPFEAIELSVGRLFLPRADTTG